MTPPQPNPSPAGAPQAMGCYRHYVIGAVIYLILMQCAVFLTGTPMALSGRADFRSFYAAGYMLHSGDAQRIYDIGRETEVQNQLVPLQGVLPYLYPAFSALLFVPFSLLRWKIAYCAFFAVNFLLLWLSARLMRESLPQLSELWQPLPLLLFFCFFPAGEALMQGQVSILLLFLYCAVFALLRGEKPLAAGMVLGLAMIKMQTALPVALFFALWRRWRVVAGFLITSAATLAISAWVTGVGTFLEYWRSVLSMAASSAGATRQFCIPPSSMANLYGLTHWITGSDTWGAFLSVAASVLVIVWVASRRCSLPMALVAGLLLSRYLGQHDLALLLLPIALALNYAVAHPEQMRARAAAIASLILLIPSVYLTLMRHEHLDWLAAGMLVFLILLDCLGTPATCETHAPVPESIVR